MTQQSLRPQDVVVLAKLVACGGVRPPLARMAAELSISGSEVHGSLRRLVASRLVSSINGEAGHRPLLGAVEEFLVHGVKYAFPATRGEVTRGMPTSYAAPPLRSRFGPTADLPPVWPFSQGQARGVTLEPLYRTVPEASIRDAVLYELLALVDAIREGRTRERRAAEEELVAWLHKQLDERPQPPSARSRR
jgi:hypothetical protein